MIEIDDFPKWERFGIHDDLPVYKVYTSEIRNWVESQSEKLWKPYRYNYVDFVFTKELEMLFLLRWS